jgi:hypothetical protein
LRLPNGADLSNLFRHRSTALLGLPLSATIYPTLAVMANSMAVLVAFAAWEAVERMGLPEAKHNLAHTTHQQAWRTDSGFAIKWNFLILI